LSERVWGCNVVFVKYSYAVGETLKNDILGHEQIKRVLCIKSWIYRRGSTEKVRGSFLIFKRLMSDSGDRLANGKSVDHDKGY